MTEQTKLWTNKQIDKFIVFNDVIGQGAYGVVYRGFSQEDNNIVAVKVLSVQDLVQSDEVQNLIKREINILSQINNLHIVKLYSVTLTHNHLYMFLEYCSGGDLKMYLKKKPNNRLEESEAITFISHIVYGFKELNQLKIIHRDIKPANILLRDGQAKISDFGFARILEQYQTPEMYSRLGSPLYMSPQILEGSAFSNKCDIWSLGIMFYEVLYGKTPWFGENQFILLKSIQKNPLTFPSKPAISAKVVNLIKEMLQMKEADRISWEKMFEVDFLKCSTENEQQVQEKFAQKNSMEQSISTIVGILNQKNIVEMNYYIKEDSKTNFNISNTMENIDTKNSKSIVDFKEEKLRKNMYKVNEYMLYERNIAFFFNFAVRSLIHCFNLNHLQINPTLFFKIIFIICKNQNIQYQRLFNMLNNKLSKDFPEQLWSSYQQTIEFIKTRQLVINDMTECEKFFKVLYKKTIDIIKVDKGEKEQPLQQQQIPRAKSTSNSSIQQQAPCVFSDVLNESFENSQQFKNIYQQILQEILLLLKDVIFTETGQKEQLIVYKYLIICKNPYMEFRKSNFDFNTFYDDMEEISVDELKMLLQQQQI